MGCSASPKREDLDLSPIRGSKDLTREEMELFQIICLYVRTPRGNGVTPPRTAICFLHLALVLIMGYGYVRGCLFITPWSTPPCRSLTAFL